MAYNTGNKPWQHLGWSDELMQTIYREWGIFFTKRNKLDTAAKYYGKSMIVNENDTGCLHNRSAILLQIAKGAESLEDSSKALELKKLDCPINLQYSKGYFYSNDFEECLQTLHNNSRKFKGGKLKPFKEYISVLNQTLGQNLSQRMVLFALEKRKTFIQVGKIMREEQNKGNKIRWKEAAEEGLCDVESIEIKPEELLHPREHERRKLAYKTANQNYIGRSWVDLVFLSKLRFDKTFLLKQTPYSTSELKQQVEDKFNQVTKFVKMLQARDPLYNLRVKNCPTLALRRKIREDHLFRVQGQTRRDMFNFLYKIKELRAQKKVMELRNYIENVMGSYTIIKIKRVMPWKYEFMNEVYNVLALAYLDQLDIPENLMSYSLENRVFQLLLIQPLKEKESIPYIFGDKSTYTESDAIDHEFITYKRHVIYLTKWLKFARYPIEKTFIYNLISQYHLSNRKFEEAVVMAIKGKNEAINKANSTLWTILNSLQIIRIQTVQKKYDILVKKYAEVLAILKKWKSEEGKKIKLVFTMANQFNNEIRAEIRRLRRKALKASNKNIKESKKK